MDNSILIILKTKIDIEDQAGCCLQFYDFMRKGFES